MNRSSYGSGGDGYSSGGDGYSSGYGDVSGSSTLPAPETPGDDMTGKLKIGKLEHQGCFPDVAAQDVGKGAKWRCAFCGSRWVVWAGHIHGLQWHRRNTSSWRWQRWARREQRRKLAADRNDP